MLPRRAPPARQKVHCQPLQLQAQVPGLEAHGRRLHDDGPQAGRRVISTLPSTGLEGIAPEATLKQAMSLMTYSRRRHLMVTDGTRLVGILSLGDIVKNLLGELELEKAVLQDIYMAAH